MPFVRALLYLVKAGGLGLTLGAVHLNQFLTIETTRQRFSDMVKQQPLQVLLRHRTALAFDKRDKIFAFQGLFAINELGATISEPDYGRDDLTVYKDFAVKTLLYYQNLDLFSIPRVQKNSKIPNLPSWVPDWSVSDLAESFLWRKIEDGFRIELQPKHRASGESTCVPVFDENNRLRIQGHLFDMISVASLAIEPAMDHGPCINKRTGSC
jgi:hypothetical protein